MPGPRQLELGLSMKIMASILPPGSCYPPSGLQRGFNMTLGPVRTPQWACNLFRRRTVLQPSSNSIPPIAWVTACATNARLTIVYYNSMLVQTHFWTCALQISTFPLCTVKLNWSSNRSGSGNSCEHYKSVYCLTWCCFLVQTFPSHTTRLLGSWWQHGG